jgi:hypothetical protein
MEFTDNEVFYVVICFFVSAGVSGYNFVNGIGLGLAPSSIGQLPSMSRFLVMMQARTNFCLGSKNSSQECCS